MIEKAGFPPYPHGLGHNLGLEIHEAPRLSRRKDAQITPGMVFTIEPGTYIKGDYGIRIEDTVLLNKDGIEVLTKSPKDI
jgi:Xaa-Pro aminopeptidase